jgi:hypothetical protein
MLCRVVADKLLPLHAYAPVEPISPDEPTHNTCDIIPNILPEKHFTYANRMDFVKGVKEGQIHTALASFFGIDLASKSQEGLTLKSGQAKRYTLNNPDQKFKELMRNELYARDVRELLKKTTFGKAYLVVGFLTTSGALWTQSETRGRTAGFQLTVPVTETLGSPIPGFADPQINASTSTQSQQGRHMHVVEEEIFAVAYDEVRFSYSVDIHEFKMRPDVVHHRPVLAQARHLAFGGDSDDEIQSSGDEDEEGNTVDGGNITIMGENRFTEDDQSRSNSFDIEIDD